MDWAFMTERILAIKLGALGDIVLADGALQDLRRHHAGAELHVLTRRAFVPLLTRCPWLDRVLVDDNAPRWDMSAMLRWRSQFVAGGYRFVYDLQNSRRTRFYRRWLTYGDTAQWSTYRQRTDSDRALSVPERHARQLASAGIDILDTRTPRPLWIAGDVTELLQRMDIAESLRGAHARRPALVVLLPGSSARNMHKRWPHYAALSKRLSALGLVVVTVPGPEETELDGGYSGYVLRDGGKPLDLHQLAGIVRAADCVVGNDSGPLHLAACLEAPCVGLFDASNPSLHATGIETRNAIRLIASPLTALPMDDVIEAVMRKIDGNP
jgi:ADP-heptose:LPS heptosyltransferase